MEHRSAIRASKSTVSPWFKASAESKDKACRKNRVGQGAERVKEYKLFGLLGE